MGLGVGYVHVIGIEPAYVREYLQRDYEHVRACAVRSAIHLHGVTVNFNTSCPLPAYFELGGLTPAHLRYANMGASALASQCYVGVAHMRCATPAQRYANVPESGPIPSNCLRI